MFLINKQRIIDPKKSGDTLKILHMNQNNLNPTSYYFCIGRQYWNFSPDSPDLWIIKEFSQANASLTLTRGDIIRVKTAEEFHLSEKAFGIIGGHSEMMLNGLRLINSPFIDPLFKGAIDVGLECLAKTSTIRPGMSIGKVSFFDVSDTYPILAPETDSDLGRKFTQRKSVRDDDPVPDHSADTW